MPQQMAIAATLYVKASQIGPLIDDQSECHSVFERFQVSDNVADLAGIESKFRHSRMTGNDSLRQRLFEILNGKALVQRAKRRRDGQRTVSSLTDRMTARTVGADDDQSALRCRR
jgi:hypothetical protein